MRMLFAVYQKSFIAGPGRAWTNAAVEQDLRGFYGSKGLKVARYRMEQREKSEVGRAIGGMLRTAYMRAKTDQRRPMVVIGDGDFRDKGGGLVKSNRFISRLQSQATGMGMLMCCVDELRTSISFCRFYKRVETQGRSVVCPDPACGDRQPSEYDLTRKLNPTTGLQRDWDHNAGQNIANAALRWVEDFKWLDALNRQLIKSQKAPTGTAHINYGR
ncbi:hypothetical protein BC939DRAFT_498771 [Gamsiella multidivaricata]|uniref:uncharacterized protein n=1 Tax=Gamsiella multidivaricata TaxID=101098 RepID=UPI00222122BE|nr:uncharacterized protein BC939DRAFT_498771 [Gamsiella multidivaricata]KAG0360098.1 hypothetical protein BGZ54_009701 [Gamsiella multidivaricata]KAI7831809.1 hypothetical protein BC939DRAFT_498771 [Gamsiella multidivaricata]